MDTKGQLEKVLQYLLNEEEDKAVDLLKKVFIQKGRSINEQIMAEEQDVVEKVLDDADCYEDADQDENRIGNMQGEIKSEEYFGEDQEGEDDTGDGLDDVLNDARSSLEHLQQLFDEIHDKLGDAGEDEEKAEDEVDGDVEGEAETEVEMDDEVKESDDADASHAEDEDELDEAAILEFSILDESVVDDLPVVKLPANKHDLAGAKTGDAEKLNPNTTSPVGKKNAANAAVIKKPSEHIPAVGEKQDGVKVSSSGVKSNFVRKSAMDNVKPVK